jgi:hypothetical protein
MLWLTGSLFLNENFFTGTVPSELGGCTSLQEVLVDGNLLNGTIPTELGLLRLRK